MDESLIYIKMSDCPEMQEGWTPQLGDFCCEGDMVFPIVNIRALKEEIANGEHIIFLRRQDQLQDMVYKPEIIEGDYYPVARMLHEFHLFIKENRKWDTASMEQLWLAFVMHELHGKAWSAEKELWILPS